MTWATALAVHVRRHGFPPPYARRQCEDGTVSGTPAGGWHRWSCATSTIDSTAPWTCSATVEPSRCGRPFNGPTTSSPSTSSGCSATSVCSPTASVSTRPSPWQPTWGLPRRRPVRWRTWSTRQWSRWTSVGSALPDARHHPDVRRRPAGTDRGARRGGRPVHQLGGRPRQLFGPAGRHGGRAAGRRGGSPGTGEPAGGVAVGTPGAPVRRRGTTDSPAGRPGRVA
jgi:hypothetical protein